MQLEKTKSFESPFETSINSEKIPQNSAHYPNHHVSRCPSPTKLELHQALEPVLTEIYTEMEKRFYLRNITPIILKNVLLEIKEKPLKAMCKFGVIIICCYLMKNLVEGIIGGEALFANFSLTMDMFSSDPATQINGGGLITNAAADVNFTIDSLVVGYAMYYLSFRNAYQKAARDIVNACFDKYIDGEQSESLSRDERNALYELKNEEMELYDRADCRQKRIPSAPLQKEEDGETNEEETSTDLSNDV